jgi:nucleotide-binding universal stress UspA family protein
MRILIGYNGTSFSRAAIEDMVNAGFPAEAEALVVTVAEPCFPTVAADEAEGLADEGVGLVQAIFPSWKIDRAVATGAAVRELISAANVFRPDIIVLGEPNKINEGAENLFLGPVSQGLLTDSGYPLRISRKRVERWSKFPRLLVGFDGSTGSERAVTAVASRSWSPGTIVRVVSIDGPGLQGSLSSMTPQLRAAAVGTGFADKWAETLAEHAMHELDAAGMCTELEVRTGLPRNVLIDSADEWDADCIFVAPRCAGNSYERFLIGSVSASVAAHANCTVEIVR